MKSSLSLSLALASAATVSAVTLPESNYTTSNCNPTILNSLLSNNDFTVSWAYAIADNGSFSVPTADVQFSEDPTGMQACCALQVEVPLENNGTFNFGMFLPDDWNGRFLAAGNAGLAGGVNWISMGDGLGYGFAVLSSDLGHNSSATDGSWAYNQPEKQIDWGYRALHESIVYGKLVTEAYYNSSIAYSYYRGCSSGGRQGLREVELFPEDFDGVVAGAPAWWTNHVQLWNAWVQVINLPTNASHYIPTELFSVIGAEALRQCDGQDGVQDHIISNSFRCQFRPETLLCQGPSANTSECLTPPQLTTLEKWYGGWYEANDTFIFPGFQPGSEWQWDTAVGLMGQDEPSGLGIDYIQYLLGLGPDWNWETEWNSADLVALSEAVNPGNATANDFDISPFYARGGKLLHYHGLADGSIATASSIFYHTQVLSALSSYDNITVSDFYRFFLVPGMGHCTSTSPEMKAPWIIGGDGQAQILGSDVSGVPGFHDAEHDVLLAMMKWVEEGVAPDYVVATEYVDESLHDEVYSQRPLCPWPLQAKYNGTGDVLAPESWNCEEMYAV